MQTQCLALIKGQYKKADEFVGEAVDGNMALIHAVKTDPDTYYVPTGNRVPTTMRQLAGVALDTVSTPGGDGILRDQLFRTLRDLPGDGRR